MEIFNSDIAIYQKYTQNWNKYEFEKARDAILHGRLLADLKEDLSLMDFDLKLNVLRAGSQEIT